MYRGILGIVSVSALAVGLAGPAGAQSVVVDGFVKNESGSGIFDADLDWFNRDTDEEVDPTGDHTSASGYYNVTIPEGRYEITVIPPAGDPYAPVFLEDVDLESSQTLPDIILPDGAMVTAHVENTSGTALSAMKFVVDDAPSDDPPVFLLQPRTDAFGDFASRVPLGSYSVTVFDAAGVYAPAAREVDVFGPTNLGTFVLEPGVTITGHVEDGGGSAIFNVNVDIFDPVTGGRLYTPNDETDFFGDFSAFVAPGTYDFLYKPAAGSPFAPTWVTGVVVSGAGAIPDVVLGPARVVTGTVVNDVGSPMTNVDVNVFDLVSGLKVYTPDDNTDGAGNFSVIVPSGLFDFTFSPPAGSGFAAAVRRDVSISASTSLGTIALERGVRISGTVTGAGLPIAYVDLDFFEAATGDVYPTPGDDTDTFGAYEVRVPAGMYTVTATPPPGSGFGPKTLPAEMYASDTVLDIELEPAVDVPSSDVVTRARLQLAPNPFRSGVSISLARLDVPEHTPVSVTIFDARGRHVREFSTTLAHAVGTGVSWDGVDAQGMRVAPGSFFVRLQAGDVVTHAKAILVR